MEKVSVFNYEAYYLDYLEGNLNEEDTALLLAFLEEYPECKLMEETLPEVGESEATTFKGKASLYMTDEEDSITTVNYDHFMIAAAENELSSEKQAELAAFIESEGLEKEKERYAAVYFKPDTSVVYADKSGLKQKETIVLWPYIATAAAACVIAVLLLWQGSGDVINAPQNMAVENTNERSNTPANIVEDVPSNVLQAVVESSPLENSNYTSRVKYETAADANVDKIHHRSARPILSDIGELELMTTATSSNSGNVTAQHKERTQDYAAVSFSNMVNPIEPITSMISKKTNTPIDFRRQKASSKKDGGFFVKVGKFEFSRKKHKK